MVTFTKESSLPELMPDNLISENKEIKQIKQAVSEPVSDQVQEVEEQIDTSQASQDILNNFLLSLDQRISALESFAFRLTGGK